MALRVDTQEGIVGGLVTKGGIQLTSVPSSGELCIDGPNRMDNCFKEEEYFPVGWIPVRKKSKNELWLDAGGVCDSIGICSPY